MNNSIPKLNLNMSNKTGPMGMNEIQTILINMGPYAAFGFAAVLSNCFILFVIFCNIPFLKKSALLTGLAVGDTIDGLALLVNGIKRIVDTYWGISKVKVHVSYCMEIFVTPLTILGNQIPGAMFFVIGLERFVAVRFFDWYYCKWSNNLAWRLIAVVYIYCICSLAVSFGATFARSKDDMVDLGCPVSTIMGPVYTAYNYSVAIVGGMTAVFATIYAVIAFAKRKNQSSLSSSVSNSIKDHIKKQWQVSKVMVCLAVLDFGLVVVPYCLVNLNAGDIKAWSLQIVSLRSTLNVFVYIIVNSEFRAAVLKTLGRKGEPKVRPRDSTDNQQSRSNVTKESKL